MFVTSIIGLVLCRSVCLIHNNNWFSSMSVCLIHNVYGMRFQIKIFYLKIGSDHYIIHIYDTHKMSFLKMFVHIHIKEIVEICQSNKLHITNLESKFLTKHENHALLA